MAQTELTEKEKAMAEAYTLYQKRMAEIAAKDETQREIESITPQLETLSAELQTMMLNPSRYGGQLHSKQAEHDRLYARLLQLQPQEKKPTGLNISASGGIYRD